MALIQESLRSIILEALKKGRPPSDPPMTVEFVEDYVGEVALRQDLHHTAVIKAARRERDRPILHDHVKLAVNDIVWDLIVEGVVRPGADDGQHPDLPRIHLTDYGKEAVKEQTTPHDPDGYLKRIKELAPNADPVIVQYIQESAHTLRVNCLLSSTVTLGCASEKTFLVLADAYAAALNSTDQATFKSKIDKERFIKKKHGVFMNWYENKLKAQIKADKVNWQDVLESGLNSIFDYFRGVRNDVGHPSGVTFHRNLVLHHLMVFPSYLEAIYKLIEWMNAKKPL